jgi:hypothetical protein
MDNIILKLGKDLKAAAESMTHTEARFLVDSYYTMQDQRIRLAAQLRSGDQPMEVLNWFLNNANALENQIKIALKHYAQNHAVGQWSMGICGIGPIISAGLLAHIDMDIAKTPGHIMSYAGIHPDSKWMGKKGSEKFVADNVPVRTKITMELVAELAPKANLKTETVWKNMGDKPTRKDLIAALARRPFNANLKILCYKIGESFVKVQNKDADVYGKLFAERKAKENKRNDDGELADQAEAKLAKYNIGKTTDAYKAYSKGKLPPAHIHARARRWTVKIFLSHWWEVAYEAHYGQKPPFEPYPIAHLGHVHKIPVPA